MNRREFIKAISAIPFLASLPLELGEQDETGAFAINSERYVLGVGNSNLPWYPNQFDLLGDKRAYKPATKVKPEDGVLAFTAEFEDGNAEFEWREIALFIDGIFVKRKPIDAGEKLPGMVWIFRYDLSVSQREPDNIKTFAASRSLLKEWD